MYSSIHIFMAPWQSGPMQKPAKLYNRGFDSHRCLILSFRSKIYTIFASIARSGAFLLLQRFPYSIHNRIANPILFRKVFYIQIAYVIPIGLMIQLIEFLCAFQKICMRSPAIDAITALFYVTLVCVKSLIGNKKSNFW